MIKGREEKASEKEMNNRELLGLSEEAKKLQSGWKSRYKKAIDLIGGMREEG